MNDLYEERIIEYESFLNEAMDEYFSARPNLVQDREQEKLFEGGFRMAWKKMQWLKNITEQSEDYCESSQRSKNHVGNDTGRSYIFKKPRTKP
jgi:hypothetical protein